MSAVEVRISLSPLQKLILFLLYLDVQVILSPEICVSCKPCLPESMITVLILVQTILFASLHFRVQLTIKVGGNFAFEKLLKKR